MLRMSNDSDLINTVKDQGTPIIGIYEIPIYHVTTSDKVCLLVGETVMTLSSRICPALKEIYNNSILTCEDGKCKRFYATKTMTQFDDHLLFADGEAVFIVDTESGETAKLSSEVICLFLLSLGELEHSDIAQLA